VPVRRRRLGPRRHPAGHRRRDDRRRGGGSGRRGALAGDAGGLGYFGFSYFEGNQDKLNLVGVDAGSGCIKPSKEAIQDGSYKPLSRPLFMYPKAASLAKPEVKAFMDFVVANQDKIAEAAKIVPLTSEQATKAKTDLGKAEAAA